MPSVMKLSGKDYCLTSRCEIGNESDACDFAAGICFELDRLYSAFLSVLEDDREGILP
jgi:hypothetical protein